MRRRRVLDERRHRLALVRSKGGDVDQTRDLRIVAGLRDHDAAVRMADENRRPVLRGQRAFRDRDVIRQRSGRILDD